MPETELEKMYGFLGSSLRKDYLGWIDKVYRQTTLDEFDGGE